MTRSGGRAALVGALVCCGVFVLMGLPVSALGAGYVPALASSLAGPPVASGGAGALGGAGAGASLSPLSGPLVIAGAPGEGRQLQDALRARLASPEAIAARARSRTAFEHLSAPGAAALARLAFPAVVDHPSSGPPALRPGEHIVRYLSDNAAQLSLPGGKHTVVESLGSIARETSHGHFAPVDLSLVPAGGGAFAPRSSPLALRIPARAAAGVALPGAGVSVTPVDSHGAPLGGAQGTVDGAGVLYASTLTDADTLVKPTTSGFAIDAVLRSVDSPSVLSYRVGMPSGASLRQDRRSGVVSVVSRGKAIAEVLAPSAQDAAGSPVPVSMRVAGDEVVLDVPGADAGAYQFPIEVDPEFKKEDSRLTNYGKYTNWIFCADKGTTMEKECFKETRSAGHFATRGWSENGALVDYSGSEYKESEYASFSYTTDGESHIYEATLSTEEANNLNEAPENQSNIESFIQLKKGSESEALKVLSISENGASIYTLKAGEGNKENEEHYKTNYGNVASYVQLAYGIGNHFNDVLKSAAVQIEQPETVKPVITLNTTEEYLLGGKWVNVLDGTGKWFSPVYGAIGFGVKEKGIGISRVWVEAETVGSKKPVLIYENNLLGNNDCSGVQCPMERNFEFSYNGEQAPPNGIDTMTVYAESATGGKAQASVILDVDTAAPTNVKLAGLPTNGQIDERPYKLRAEATEGSGSTLSSGIKAIKLVMDEHEVLGQTLSGSCTPGPCTTASEWTIRGEHFPAGSHKIKVFAEDYAGHKTDSEEYTVTVRHAGGLPVGPGSVNPITGALHLGAQDVSIDDGMAALSVSRSYDSRELTIGERQGQPGPLGLQWQFNIAGSQEVQPESTGSVTLISAGGGRTTFESNGKGGFISPPGDENLVLEAEKEGETIKHYLLKDSAKGTTVRYGQPFSGGPWVMESSEGALSKETNEQTIFEWEHTLEGVTRPKLAVAPAPTGYNCSSKPTQSAFCRSLEFKYAESTTATGEAPSEWKNYKNQLEKILFFAWNTTTKKMESKAVAEYAYDKQGRLRAEWNPQISPALKTTYGYDAEGHVTSIDPPGQEPWILHYGTTTSDSNPGRLLSVTRPPAGTGTSVKEQDEKAMPTNTAAPTLSTTSPVIGTALSVSGNGTWSNSPLAYSYQWEDCNGKGGECTAILGAVNKSYTPVLGDAGHELVAQVTATNADGAVTTASAATSKVALPAPAYLRTFGKNGSGAGEFKDAGGVALEANGDVWATDAENNRIEEFSSTGSFIEGVGWDVNSEKAEKKLQTCTSKCQAGESGSEPGELTNPEGIAVDQGSGDVYVADGSSTTSLVQEFSATGAFVASFGGTGSGKGQLKFPHGLAIDANGNVWVADSNNNRIVEFSASGTFSQAIGWGVANGEAKIEVCTASAESCQAGIAGAGEGQLDDPHGIAIVGGDVYVTDSLNKRVEEFSAAGGYVAKFGSSGSGEGQFSDPWGIAASPLNGDLYVTDVGNQRVEAFTGEGAFLKQLGSSGSEGKDFNGPVGIAISESTGEMYIADEYNSRVDEWEPSALVQEPAQSPPALTTSAVTTIDYNVPLEGSGLHTMTKEEVETWGQKDDPIEGVAIFPADEPMGWPAKDYTRATVWYFDEDGRAVNVANPAGGVSTSEYNEESETVRALSADNRETALKEGTKTAKEEASERLDTKSHYNGETLEEKTQEETKEKEGKGRKEPGARLLEVTGPEHKVRLTGSGEERQARNNVRYFYNEGAPEGGVYDLVTKTIDSSLYESKYHEERTVTDSYSGQYDLGWRLRKPTSVTTEPGKLNLTTTTVYDPNTGKALETRSPAGSMSMPSYFAKFTTTANGVAAGAGGDIWVTHGHTIEEFSSGGTLLQSFGTEGEGEGKLKETRAIAIGPSNTVWVADASLDRVEEFSEKGAFIKQFGSKGTGNGQFEQPLGIALGSGGTVWVTDSGNYRVEEFNGKGEYIAQFGGKGSGNGQFERPSGIAVDAAGDIWVTAGYSRVEEFSPSDAYMTQIDTETSSPCTDATHIAVDANGELWIGCGSKGSSVVEFSPSGQYIGLLAARGAGTGQVEEPEGVAVDTKGNVWVADLGNKRVQEFGPASEYLSKRYVTQIGLSSPGERSLPVGVARAANGDLWVADKERNRIYEYSPRGWPLQAVEGESKGAPTGIAIDAKGNIWVTDGPLDCIEQFNSEGKRVSKISAYWNSKHEHLNLPQPHALAIDSEGNLWVTVSGSKILVINPTTSQLEREFGSEGTGNGQFKEADGITIDAKGDVWVVDHGNNRLEEFSSTGTYLSQIDSLEEPMGVVSGDSAGDVWVSENKDHEVKEYSTSGEYLTTLGSGHGTTGAELSKPTGLVIGVEGEVFIADEAAERIAVWGTTGASSNPSAHDSQVIYYTAEANSSYPACGNHPEWAELVCRSQPVVQPGATELPNLPVVTDETYNIWDEPEVVKENFEKTSKFAEATRTKKMTYDSAGRLLTNEESGGSGTSLPKVTDSYNAETGAMVEQSTTSGAIKSVYNTLGQLTEYVDADSNKTVYTYDEDGRTKTVNDGKGEQKYTYSKTTGLLTELADSAAKTFTAAYDGEGKMTSQTYPNAMKAVYTYNSVGEKTGITYEKTAHCAGTCPEVWFKETVSPSIHGEVLLRASTLAKEEYVYDSDGRLLQVNETPTGAGCKTRLYAYNEDSARISQTTRESSTETCAISGGKTVSHSYDSADRLTDAGVEYEAFGNQTKLPGADTEELPITATFYVDNQTRSETQNGETITYYTDPAGRVRETVSSGTTKATVINHFPGSGEAVSWSSEESKWTRNVPGIDGTLTAVEKSGEETTPALQLHDLQGNIVAEAMITETITKLVKTYNATEFGVPVNGTAPKYSWLGALGLVTEVPSSGENSAGGTSYVSQLGALLQTQTVIPPGAAPNGNYISPYISTITASTSSVLSSEAAEGMGRAAARQREAEEKRRWEEEHPPTPPGSTPSPNEGGVEGSRQTDPAILLTTRQAEVLAAALRKGPEEVETLAFSGLIREFTVGMAELVVQLPQQYMDGMAYGLERCWQAIDSAYNAHARCRLYIDDQELGEGGPMITIDWGVETCWGEEHDLAGKRFWTYPYCHT